MKVRIAEYEVGDESDGYFFINYAEGVAAVAINPDIAEPLKEACRVYALGMAKYRPPKGLRKWIIEDPHSMEYDPNVIAAMRLAADEAIPDRVKEVKETCQFLITARAIGGWCHMAPSLAYAIVENLKERGEMPEWIDWGA